MGGEVGTLPLRDSDSRSRKSDHSSANDSLLLELLAMSMGSLIPLLRDGVDGVLRKGDIGMRRLVLEVPGRARPACSFCSEECQRPICRLLNLLPTITPAQQRRDQLQRLELLWVRPVDGQEMKEVVRHDLPVYIVFWPSLFQDT